MSAELGVIVSIVAIIIAAFSAWYTRKRSRTAEEQLKMVKNEKVRKYAFEKASEVVQEAITQIQESIEAIKYEISHHLDIGALRDEIIRVLYDEKREELELNFNPSSLEMSFVGIGETRSYAQHDSFDDFETNTLNKMFEDNLRPLVWLHCKWEPEILGEVSIIELSAIFEQLNNIYQSSNRLIEYKNQIDMFDNTILGEIQKSLKDIFKSAYESIMKTHKITITKNTKSADVRNMLEEILGVQSIERFLDQLIEETRQLSRVRRELFEAST